MVLCVIVIVNSGSFMYFRVEGHPVLTFFLLAQCRNRDDRTMDKLYCMM